MLSAPEREPWNAWPTIRAVNPMVDFNPALASTITRERDEAERNPSLRPAFEAYRLNRGIDPTREVLLTVAEWERVAAREVPERDGRPIVGVDVGGERSWSAVWAQWPNGRAEAFATMPGIPTVAEREKADARPVGFYRDLVDNGSLLVDEGRHMARLSLLVDHLDRLGIEPACVYADRFLLGQLRDALGSRCPVEPRRVRWSESTEDIAAFRRAARDGGLAIAPDCRRLVMLALSQTKVVSDAQGNAYVAKLRHGRSRDDVAVAGVLALGAMEREPIPQPLMMAVA